MKTYPFYTQHTITRLPLQRDYIHMYIYFTNAHLTTIRHLSNIDIFRSLIILDRLIQNAPYFTSPSTKPFHSLLTIILHLYDTNQHATTQSTTYYPTPPQIITSTHTPRRQRSIITDPNKWARVPHDIRPNNLALLVAYTHTLVTALSPITTLVLQ